LLAVDLIASGARARQEMADAIRQVVGGGVLV
jgi:hypothetical protein